VHKTQKIVSLITTLGQQTSWTFPTPPTYRIRPMYITYCGCKTIALYYSICSSVSLQTQNSWCIAQQKIDSNAKWSGRADSRNAASDDVFGVRVDLCLFGSPPTEKRRRRLHADQAEWVDGWRRTLCRISANYRQVVPHPANRSSVERRV